MPVKLTKRYLDGLMARPARYDVYDSLLAGFAVRVAPDGSKSFSLVYRAGSGRSAPKRRMTIGRFGALTVDEARKFAREMLTDIARGADPAVARATAKGAPTVASFGIEFFVDVQDHRKPSTAREYGRQWKKHILPTVGTARVAEVTTADVAKLHRSLRETPYLANRVLALFGVFFNFAERRGIRAKHTNPAEEITAYKERARERYLTPEEVIRLGKALTKAERTGLPAAPNRRRERKTGPTAKHRSASADRVVPANPFAIAAIRFLILTGWREREALDLRWAEIDTARGIATLPDTKTDRSIRQLGASALGLLSSLPRVAGSPFVFPGRAPGQALVEINRVWYAVRHHAGLDDVRLHDLRHTFASVSASSGESLAITGKLLGHKESATTAKYSHLHDNPVRNAADRTSNRLDQWLSGELGSSL